MKTIVLSKDIFLIEAFWSEQKCDELLTTGIFSFDQQETNPLAYIDPNI